MAEFSDSFGWDDEFETSDGGGFQLLDEGPCKFTITEFRRGRFEGSARMAPCYQAELKLQVSDLSGHTSDVNSNLPLNRKMAWKLTSLFKAVGLLDPNTPSGTNVRYEWDKLLGTSGICEIEHYDWTGNDGQTRTGNSVKAFLFGDRSDEAARAFGMPKQVQRPYGGTF